jgi:hypothetical protein
MSGKVLSKLKTWRYNEKKLIEFLENELEDDLDFRINIENGKNSFLLRTSGRKAWIYISLDKLTFDEKKSEICLELDGFFQGNKGIVAYACSGKDWFFQNITGPDWYPTYGKSTEGLPLVKSRINSNWTEVDIEIFPGHEHNEHELWFGSCWLMWFGEYYPKMFSKEIFLNFNNCYENEKLEDGSIKIQLYEDIWDYENETNRKRQWDFRRTTGIDEVAHKLISTPMIIEHPDPSIVLSKAGIFEHGGVRLAKSYHNEHGDVVPKSRAVECRTFEFDKDGKAVWIDIQKINGSD